MLSDGSNTANSSDLASAVPTGVRHDGVGVMPDLLVKDAHVWCRTSAVAAGRPPKHMIVDGAFLSILLASRILRTEVVAQQLGLDHTRGVS